uniref:Uncharacterized protein n=1 Tax=Oryza punctata TaxID=4537 RepID=A0A0E0L1B7_ORYPU
MSIEEQVRGTYALTRDFASSQRTISRRLLHPPRAHRRHCSAACATNPSFLPTSPPASHSEVAASPLPLPSVPRKCCPPSSRRCHPSAPLNPGNSPPLPPPPPHPNWSRGHHCRCCPRVRTSRVGGESHWNTNC